MTAAVQEASSQAQRVRSRGALLRSNSIASAIRAGSTSLTTILLPIVLVVALPEATYAVWALVASIAAFTLYFDLGAQASVLALVGKADAQGDRWGAVSAGRAGVRVALGVGGTATAVGAVLGSVLGMVFPSIAPERVPAAAVTLVLLFIGQGLSLTGSALAAYFGGRQQTASATAVLVPARILSLILTSAAALLGADLVVLGVAFVLPLLGGVVVLGACFQREARDVPRLPGSDAISVRRLLRFSGTLMFWNLCMLVVSGVDVAVVGRLDFSHVALYSVASTIAVGIAGLDNAVLAPLLPELSGRLRMNDRHRAGELLRFATRTNALLLVGSFVAVGALSPVLAGLLLPAADQRTVCLVMLALAGANCLRLTMAPLSLAFIAAGTHTRLILQPMLEAAANLVASIALGLALGALGVALGTVVGAAVGVVAALAWSLRVSGEGLVSGGALLKQALVIPVLAWAPALLLLAVVVFTPLLGTAPGTWIALGGIALSAPGALAALGPAGRAPFRRLLPVRVD